ncbi:MAG: chemotaxis protein CheW [Salinivirgaceae bacterium]|nr:chemotaxis protein CheW [Salinivirgaceae bacterium]
MRRNCEKLVKKRYNKLQPFIFPIIDSRIKFGIANTEFTSKPYIIVIDVNNKPLFIGVLVDSVDSVVEVEDNEIKDPSSLGDNYKTKYIIGVIHYDIRYQ